MRRLVGNVSTAIDNLPARRPRLPEDRHQQGRFAGTVGADQAHRFAFVDVQRDFLQGLDRPVEHIDLFHFEDR
ncbi:hypothetical protein D3C77_618040 [compost metagenome]